MHVESVSMCSLNTIFSFFHYPSLSMCVSILKCLCYFVITIAHDLHTHFALLSYYIQMSKNIHEPTKCKSPLWFACMQMVGFCCCFFLRSSLRLTMIIWFASSFLFKHNKGTETKLNWKHLFNKWFCKFLQYAFSLSHSHFGKVYIQFSTRLWCSFLFCALIVWRRFTFYSTTAATTRIFYIAGATTRISGATATSSASKVDQKLIWRYSNEWRMKQNWFSI